MATHVISSSDAGVHSDSTQSVEGRSLLTFRDLLTEVDLLHAKARGDRSKSAWQLLRQVVTDLAGQGSDQADVVSGRRWHLTNLTIEGFQGISDEHPLTLDLDPTPGVTVIHGANGSGKSSLSDAVRLALAGGSGLTVRPKRGGKIPLWAREPRGRGARSARITLELRDGRDALRFAWQLHRSGELAWGVARHADGATHDVELGESWRSALAAHPPVFSYADHEQRLQASGDLQEHLAALLALGGCFDAVKVEIGERSRAAEAAHTVVEQVWTSAMRAVADVDQRLASPDLPGLASLERPPLDGDIDSWLAKSGLPLSTNEQTATFSMAEFETVRRTATETTAAINALTDAAMSVVDRLHDPLRALARAAHGLQDTGHACPVCRTSTPDWLTVLDDSLATARHTEELGAAVARALTELHAQSAGTVQRILAVPDSHPDPDRARTRTQLVEVVQGFADAVLNFGCRPHPLVRSAAIALADTIASPGGMTLATWAAEQSAHERQWLNARREVVEPFLTAWRAHGMVAARFDEWRDATTKLADLERRLRADRATALSTGIADQVHTLLPDHGIRVVDIEVQAQNARIGLSDPAGELELNMLSAGQRNALLLAPLLAVTEHGPFGFLILDDPVHAFDGLRVDHLAAAIADVAQHRRVIVLTHDERLKEQLIARVERCDCRTIIRDADEGAVTVTTAAPIWQQLLTDAAAALRLAEGASPADLTGTSEVVRGLCRLAVDDALRAFVVRRCLRQGRDWIADVALLDKASTTFRRFDAADALCAGDDADRRRLARARDTCEPYRAAWNAAAHGERADTVATADEIKAARSAAKKISE